MTHRYNAIESVTKRSTNYMALKDKGLEKLQVLEIMDRTNDRRLCNQPPRKPTVGWMISPQMPEEWNERIMMALLAIPQIQPPTFRTARADEISAHGPLQVAHEKTHKGQHRLKEPTLTRTKRIQWVTKPLSWPIERTTALSEVNIPNLCQYWCDKYQDIMNGVANELLPFWEVNHKIHLINKNRQYQYHAPCCPMSLREEFHKKINHYVDNGWWEPRPARQAAPLLCIFKKDSRLRTVIDAQQCNKNSIKDVMPLPDQEII